MGRCGRPWGWSIWRSHGVWCVLRLLGFHMISRIAVWKGTKEKRRESLSWDLSANQFWKLIRAFSPLKFPASSSSTTEGNSSITPHVFPLKPWCTSSNTERKLLLCPFPKKVAVPTTDLFDFSKWWHKKAGKPHFNVGTKINMSASRKHSCKTLLFLLGDLANGQQRWTTEHVVWFCTASQRQCWSQEQNTNPSSLACVTSQGATGYVSMLTKQTCILLKPQLQQNSSWKAKGQKETNRLHLYF